MYAKVLSLLQTEIVESADSFADGACSSPVGGRDAAGIARALGALVNRNVIDAGDKLPPIRAVAKALGVSTATVAEAWTLMRAHGLIDTDRRRGTTVRPFPGHGRSRYWRVPMPPGTLSLDLSTGMPDPLLLPPLAPILARVNADIGMTSYLDPPMLPDLEIELRSQWPYEPPAMAIVNGANDGLDRVIRSTVRLGDVVVVEDPTYPLLLDLLELAGARVVGLPLDRDGPDLAAAAAAMLLNPKAVIIQTGAHNPTGVSLTQDRADALAELMRETNTIVIEDNHAGATADRPAVSLGAPLPSQVFRIHSFSKTHGPDLRIAAMSGPVEGIKEIEQRRQLGPGWTSRLIQRILLEMIRSAEVNDQIRRASGEYRRRRIELTGELSSRGIHIAESHGLNIWVPVAQEQMATVALASQGVGVAPGEPFRVGRNGQHLRVTAANVRNDFDGVAQRIAHAAATPGATR